jgi:hypothetical protein
MLKNFGKVKLYGRRDVEITRPIAAGTVGTFS